MKNLIGKKVRGFKFESEDYPQIGYNEDMSKYINQIGVMLKDNGVACEVQFAEGQIWCYPIDLIKEHLYEEVQTIESSPQPAQYINPNGDIINTIVDAYFNGTSLPQIRESIRQAYTAIEAGVNAQLVEIKEERGKI